MKFGEYFFKGHLDDGERILYIAHKHPFIFLRDSFKSIFFLLAMPIFFYLILPQFLVIYLFWFGSGLVAMGYHFIDWYFDAWLLTNAGVIDVEKNGLFEKNSTRVDYHMIEAIAYNINGFWATILNFGDITVDKIGANTSVILKEAGDPKGVERAVMRYQERYVSDRSIRDHNALKSMLSEMIAYHVQGGKIDANQDRD